MFKTIALILLALIACVLIYAATKPDSFKLERSALIQASPDKVYPLIADLKAFNTWNPWLRKEPTAALTYTGPASGPGARYAWVGKETGEGSMEIAESVPASRVAFKLDFTKPMEAHNLALFTLAPEGGGTRVTWSMSGPAPYMTKLMDTIVGMDRMVGPDFEAGLANLKAAAESAK
ncbi:SRPBCC family protein [Pelomonas sp. KK5]|uniref:SRPBCC family protein n=1 Tax=Pelomonas sp. KK5 TaxID=1855730 RepID=UPI00097C5D41|nr:SRPBCC family protein [Pelomonas sp. KK5]